MAGGAGAGGGMAAAVPHGSFREVVVDVAFRPAPGRPRPVGWLTAEEKSALRHQHEQDHPDVETSSHTGFWQMARDPKIYGLVLVDILLLGANDTMVFSIPSSTSTTTAHLILSRYLPLFAEPVDKLS